MPEPTPYFDESGAEERDNVIPYTFPLTNMDFSSYRTDEHWPSESLARIFCPKLYEFRISLR